MTSQSLTFALEGVNCAGCISKIENHISQRQGVMLARGNATTRRIRLVWDPAHQTANTLADQIRALGYGALPFHPGDAMLKEPSMLPQLGLAGFAMMNIMGISFAVWAGVGTDMGPGSMQFLHWISAALATPVVFYAGAVFYAPALRALQHGQMTMDTPITVAILVTFAASVFETLRGTHHVYFDAVTALIFFLLIGRVIELVLKRRSGDAAENLRNLMHIEARRELPDGAIERLPADQLYPNDIIIVETGERVPADGILLSEHAQVDESAISGETLPRDVDRAEAIAASAIVFAGPARLRVTHVGEDAQIGKIAQMISDASGYKGPMQKRADQFARSYIPLVLGGGVLGFVIWYVFLGASFADALMIAVAVLVVTCPCAAGLATPAVSARAVNLLMASGIVVKSGDALERLSNISAVIADKTGTLSAPLPQLFMCDEAIQKEAAKLAIGSSHPLARMLCADLQVVPAAGLSEKPGRGILASNGARLGSAHFVGADQTVDHPALWYCSPEGQTYCFSFHETPRDDLEYLIHSLRDQNLPLTLLSGDSHLAVTAFAQKHGIKTWHAAASPQDKLRFLQDCLSAGEKPLMFGDGINDAPALQAAYVSVSFASATEVAQITADIVLAHPDPKLLPYAIATARDARHLIGQNLWFSAAYNIVTVPLALAGLLSPLIAAGLMSASSIIVLANSLRLKEPK
jgi:P-type Cu2+ transporter